MKLNHLKERIIIYFNKVMLDKNKINLARLINDSK